MKWLIASDLHGSAVYTEKLLEAFKGEEADRLLLLGDLLYHGPRNDLPEGYDPKKVIALLNGVKKKIFCVGGNCDAAVDQMVLEFPVLAEYALIPCGRSMIFATHGHLFSAEHLPPLSSGDILLHGHTHVPVCLEKEAVHILNPGSVSLPKENSPHSYMTLEDGCFRWKNLLTGESFREYFHFSGER